MKPAFRVPVVLLLATLAAGCASTSEPTAAAPAPSGVNGVVIEKDQAYINQVERVALRRGIDVTWVNPPSKRRPAGRR